MSSLGPTALPSRLLGVWAHPDDEAYLSAGLMARVTDAGGHVTCVTATRGELGFADDDPRSLAERAQLRTDELADALATVGVEDLRFLGLTDGECAQIPTLLLVAQIGEIIENVQPELIVTFGPDGITGHPDHVAISSATTLAWQSCPIGDLLYAAHTDEFLDRHQVMHDRIGLHADHEPLRVAIDELDAELDLDTVELDRKRAALAAHASQTTGLAELMGEAYYRSWVCCEMFRRPTAAELATPVVAA